MCGTGWILVQTSKGKEKLMRSRKLNTGYLMLLRKYITYFFLVNLFLLRYREWLGNVTVGGYIPPGYYPF